MGDLISRSALIEVIKKQKVDNDAYCSMCIETMAEIVEEQPTAYDVEKVVAELEESGQKMSEAKGNPWDSSDHKYYKAISVKKGNRDSQKGWCGMRIEIHAEKGNELFSPLEFATALIRQKVFDDGELEELAEYLLVHSKHNKEEGAT